MADHNDLAGLLRTNLDTVPVPDDYELLRQRLISIRPHRDPPTIKESPENRYPLATPGTQDNTGNT